MTRILNSHEAQLYASVNPGKMKVEQKKFSKTNGWETLKNDLFDVASCTLVLAFGNAALLEDPFIFKTIRELYPNAAIVINSTAGEIYNTQVNDETISVTAICFEKTTIKTAVVQIDEMETSRKAGNQLAKSFCQEGLKNILVISDGQKVNGSELVQGLQESLPAPTIITGGLAGDGPRFKRTLVGLNEQPIEGRIIAIGFYGEKLTVSCGSAGGWNTFGPERQVTKSTANILYELDGKPALDIYKKYLGEYAEELPGSGLLFPLCIRVEGSEELIVRTILAVNEESKSLTFAGNMPEGSYARLMMANFDRLIEGASNAARISLAASNRKPTLAVLISCVGRKLVLDQRIEEEVEQVKAMYGSNTAIAGFYSYGEISPSDSSLKCELHNQTMTITTFSEDE